MNLPAELFKFVFNGWIWGLAALLSGALMQFLNGALGKEKNRRQLDRLVRERRWATIYGELMGAALDRVDAWLTPAKGPSPEAIAVEARRAWSWPLLDVSLRLAVAYPIVTLIVAWVLLGHDGKLGDLVVLPATDLWLRATLLAALALSAWLVYLSRLSAARGKRYWKTAYLWLAGWLALPLSLPLALSLSSVPSRARVSALSPMDCSSRRYS